MQRFLIYMNNFLLRLIGRYFSKDPSYSKLYNLNHRLMGVSASPVPGTWLELDWISAHPWHLYKDFDENHLLNAFRRQQLINEIRDIENRKVEGDFLELGVYKGFSAHVMLSYGSVDRKYFGFDTFLGLSEPIKDVDGNHWVKGDLAFSETAAMKKLDMFKTRVTLIKGEIPGVFRTVPTDKMQFALVHIDLDLYEPTKSGLHFAWERLTPGGSLICDDYGFATCPGASKAVDEFFMKRNDFEAFRSVVGGIVVRKHG
jgi:O-methyltransferase